MTHKLPARQAQEAVPAQWLLPAPWWRGAGKRGSRDEEACGKGQRNRREGGKSVHESFLELESMEQTEDLSPEPGKCSWTGE